MMWAFMFTDIENSTDFLRQDEQAAAQAIFNHRNVVRRCVKAHGGRVINTTGDGVLAAYPFTTVHKARPLECAVALQSRFQQRTDKQVDELRLRITIHCGRAMYAEGDFIGLAVNLTQRMLGLAKGGQILVTPEAMVHFPPSTEMQIHDRGFHKLKGFGDALQQVLEIQYADAISPRSRVNRDHLRSAGQQDTTIEHPSLAWIG
ncbi:MAG: adenylate/guanylate cyclase domain-containing protein [Anaerolineaceae bacterium]|nr:adenylate/guanylate cyclase domain-containing protein [Anaerolineaceae bacterium]